MPSEKKHILVTGSNRSGTTWVGKMLCASNELNYIYEPFSDDYNTLKVDTPVKHHFHYVTNNESQYFKRYIDCCLSPMNISLIKEITANGIYSGIKKKIKQIIELPKFKNTFIIKDPLALFSASWFYQTYNCHILVMIRHPAAYVDSIRRVGWRYDPRKYLEQYDLIKEYLSELKEEISSFNQTEKNLLEEATLRWKIYHHVIHIYMDRYPFTFIKHEELAEDPINNFKIIYDKYNLTFNESVVSEIQNSITGEKNLGNKVHVLKRDLKNTINNWKKNLKQTEIDYIYSKTYKISSLFYGDDEWGGL
jgi:hypothetical protein